MQPLTGIVAVLLLSLGVSRAQFEPSNARVGVAPPWVRDPPGCPELPPQTSSPGVLNVPGVGELHGLAGYKMIKGRSIDAYLGVRYAKVNEGLGRFQPACPVSQQGRIDATKSSENCAQFPEVQRLQEAEARGENVDDCLTLNIYAPAGARNLPVLVFVHGEMLFDGGANEAEPDYVLEHDVVLVAVNYRLAPFGFLSALSDELPGNVALSDLQLALEWVQLNICAFGGNRSQVTLVGQAGGATLAHAFSLNPPSENLFQQLILQSGTALNPYLIDERPLATLATFARLAHCPPSAGRNLGPIYECLRRLRTSQLVKVFEQLFQQNEPNGLSALGGFKLVVGDRLGHLPAHPAELLARNAAKNISTPMIVGATKDASAFILSRFYNQIQGLQSSNISDYINIVLRHTAPPQQHKIWHDWALREIFTPEQRRYVNARSVTQGLLELSNLILYRSPVVYSIRATHRKSPAYLYTFDYRGQHHRFGHLESPLPFGVDASLSDDSVYLFPFPVEASRLNTEDMALARSLVAMWVNFAQTGEPNPVLNVWPKASSEYGPFLRFTNSRHSILELDQHFGEGINVPNLYAMYNATAPLPQEPSQRPWMDQCRRQGQPWRVESRQQAPVQPWNEEARTQPPVQPWNEEARRQPPMQPWNEEARRQPPVQAWNEEARRQPPVQPWREERRQQLLREQQEREEQEREKQQTEDIAREEEERKREQKQREEQLQREQQQREQQQREQYERELRQRVQQQQELKALQQQEQREQAEREQQQIEQELRQQREREQQQREQLEREQQQRAERPYEMPELTDEQREQQERAQQEREDQERAQQEREQQEREQQQRVQMEREQLEREQNMPQPVDYQTYEDYVKAYTDWIESQNVHFVDQEASAEETPYDSHSDPYVDPYSDSHNNPERIELMHLRF